MLNQLDSKFTSVLLKAAKDGTGGGLKQDGAGGSNGQSSRQNPHVVMFLLESNPKIL